MVSATKASTTGVFAINALGQRVKKFSLRAWKDERYETIAQQTTIGCKRILVFPVVRTRKLQLVIEESKASPMITNIRVFKTPDY